MAALQLTSIFSQTVKPVTEVCIRWNINHVFQIIIQYLSSCSVILSKARKVGGKKLTNIYHNNNQCWLQSYTSLFRVRSCMLCFIQSHLFFWFKLVYYLQALQLVRNCLELYPKAGIPQDLRKLYNRA